MDSLYDEAGELVTAEEDQISLTKYSHLLKDDVAIILAQVLEENPLPFQLADFQKIAIHAIGSMQNVILLSPTGSGKMAVAYLSILVLQKKLGIPSGVGVGTQPLSSIMNEKLKNPYITTGTISMQGNLKASTDDDDEDDVTLSSSIGDFKDGTVKCLIGHAESWATETAGEVLDSLQEKGLILFSFLDEGHTILDDNWNTFRPMMKQVPGQLRGRTVRGAPCLAMTATLTPMEIEELKKSLGLRSANTVVLQANPIQGHHKYIRLVLRLFFGMLILNFQNITQSGACIWELF
jgi:superfamily II DNA helicase RecQ